MIKTYIKSLLLITMLVIGVAFHVTPVAAQSATYSCGTYGGGNYSQTDCTSNGTGGGTNTTTATSSDQLGPPNTGFAKLLQPQNLITLVASIVALVVGIAMLMRLRKQRQ